MFSTFVINLDKDLKRLDFMHKQLLERGIEYRRKPAVLGKTYAYTSEEYDEKKAIEKGGRKLLPGELGCALSHAQVLEAIINEKISYALVLEDDISLSSNFKEIVENEIRRNARSNKWDYLLFDYVPVGVTFLRAWIKGVKQNYARLKQAPLLIKMTFIAMHILKGLYIVPLSFFEMLRERCRRKYPGPVRFFRPVYFAGAYLITLEGARKLNSLTHPIIYTADQLPNRARIECNLRFRCYSPLVVSQKKYVFGSSILELTGEEVSRSL